MQLLLSLITFSFGFERKNLGPCSLPITRPPPPPLHLVSYLPRLLGIVSILSLNSYRVFLIILTVIDNYAIIVIIDYF